MLNSFKDFCKLLFTDISGTQVSLMNQYIKDVSSMLALTFAVREQKYELYLCAEQELLPKCFLFNHINYSRHLTFQLFSMSTFQELNIEMKTFEHFVKRKNHS